MADAGVLTVLRNVTKEAGRRARHTLAQPKGPGSGQPLPAALDAERHVIATADAGVISYYEDSTHDGRPLVLLHGVHAAGSAFEMKTLFTEFRGERPVYALDLPGYGTSQRGGMPYSAQTYVRAIEHLLRHIATERDEARADVVALSLTCEYAAQVAAELPQLVHSLVFISPTGFESTLRKTPERRRMPAMLRAAAKVGGELFYDALVTRGSLAHYLRRSFAGDVDRELLDYAYATSHQPGAHYAPLAFIAGDLYPEEPAKNIYERVRVPVLVLYDQDPYTTFGGLRAFVCRSSSYAAERLYHTRGLPHIEARERTVRAMRAYWERLEQDESGVMRRSRTAIRYHEARSSQV